MHDTPKVSPSLPSARVRRGIARGGRFACTVLYGGTVNCLRRATAWCPTCDAPRCDDHSVAGCAVCDRDTIAFSAIKDGTG